MLNLSNVVLEWPTKALIKGKNQNATLFNTVWLIDLLSENPLQFNRKIQQKLITIFNWLDLGFDRNKRGKPLK